MWPLLYCVAGVRGAPVLSYGASIQVGKPSTSSLYTERWTWRGKKNTHWCGIVVGFHWNICSRGVHIIITTEEQLIICNATLPRFTSLFFTLSQTFFIFLQILNHVLLNTFINSRYLWQFTNWLCVEIHLTWSKGVKVDVSWQKQVLSLWNVDHFW